MFPKTAHLSPNIIGTNRIKTFKYSEKGRGVSDTPA